MQKIKEFYWHCYSKYLLPYKKIKEKDYSIANTVLIAGSARSGTTWLGDVLSKILNARPIFEPFILDQNKNFYFSSSLTRRYWKKSLQKKLLMNYSIYISDKERPSPKIYNQIESILSGRVRSQWIDRGVDYEKVYEKRVIKEVRANLMLSFLARSWPELKIIYIIRSPYNVIKSQIYLSIFYDWSFDFDDRMLEQKSLIRDWLYPYLNKIRKADKLAERLAHRWCIENYIPIKQSINKLPNVLLVSYDRLLSSKDCWKKILDFLDCENKLFSQIASYIATKSHTTVKREPKKLDIALKRAGYSDSLVENILSLYEIPNYWE